MRTESEPDRLTRTCKAISADYFMLTDVFGFLGVVIAVTGKRSDATLHDPLDDATATRGGPEDEASRGADPRLARWPFRVSARKRHHAQPPYSYVANLERVFEQFTQQRQRDPGQVGTNAARQDDSLRRQKDFQDPDAAARRGGDGDEPNDEDEASLRPLRTCMLFDSCAVAPARYGSDPAVAALLDGARAARGSLLRSNSTSERLRAAMYEHDGDHRTAERLYSEVTAPCMHHLRRPPNGDWGAERMPSPRPYVESRRRRRRCSARLRPRLWRGRATIARRVSSAKPPAIWRA